MRAQPVWEQENNDPGPHQYEVVQERNPVRMGVSGRNGPRRGRGAAEKAKALCRRGWGLPNWPGETVPNAAPSAFPPQGEKGAAGSPGLLGLLGQKVGIGKPRMVGFM